MDRQARTGDAVLVKSREITGRNQTVPCWLGGKENRKQNTLAPLLIVLGSSIKMVQYDTSTLGGGRGGGGGGGQIFAKTG
jgi:hypothetical protein